MCLVDANYSHRLTVTSITVSHTEQPAKQHKHARTHTHYIYTHMHTHKQCAHLCKGKVKHPNSHIYAHPHMNAHDTRIHHIQHIHMHTLSLCMYILHSPWPSSALSFSSLLLVLSFSLFVLICSAVSYELCIISLWSEKS